jgi:E3 ubiquitin-protein ligase synoviolin
MAEADSETHPVSSSREQQQEKEMEDERRRRREEEMERLMLEQEQQEDDGDAAAAAAAEDGAILLDQQQQLLVPLDNNDNENENDPLLLQRQQQQHAFIAPRNTTPLLSYRSTSLLAFVGLLYYALRTRRQYYLAAVYLSSSKWAYVVTGNAILVAALSLFDAVIRVGLHGLRPHEAEGLQDFFRWNVTETCLALTMFRNELTVTTALQFVALITVKCWHHVAAQREQHWRLTEEAVTGTFPYIRHWSLLFFLIFLQLLDLLALQYAVESLVETGPTVVILFAFEAAIMLVNAWSHILLWHLHVVDSIISFGHDRDWKLACRMLHPWKECKATLTFAVELQAQAVQFVFYATFFSIVMTYVCVYFILLRDDL